MNPATERLDRYRQRTGLYGSDPTEGNNGLFYVPGPLNRTLQIIASDGSAWAESGLGGLPWEHVSVSTARHTPHWDEMCFVKELFWLPEETVIQFHPPKSQYINNHAHCLHLWRPCGIELPMPPGITVGLSAS